MSLFSRASGKDWFTKEVKRGVGAVCIVFVIVSIVFCVLYYQVKIAQARADIEEGGAHLVKKIQEELRFGTDRINELAELVKRS